MIESLPIPGALSGRINFLDTGIHCSSVVTPLPTSSFSSLRNKNDQGRGLIFKLTRWPDYTKWKIIPPLHPWTSKPKAINLWLWE